MTDERLARIETKIDALKENLDLLRSDLRRVFDRLEDCEEKVAVHEERLQNTLTTESLIKVAGGLTAAFASIVGILQWFVR